MNKVFRNYLIIIFIIVVFVVIHFNLSANHIFTFHSLKTLIELTKTTRIGTEHQPHEPEILEIHKNILTTAQDYSCNNDLKQSIVKLVLGELGHQVSLDNILDLSETKYGGGSKDIVFL